MVHVKQSHVCNTYLFDNGVKIIFTGASFIRHMLGFNMRKKNKRIFLSCRYNRSIILQELLKWYLQKYPYKTNKTTCTVQILNKSHLAYWGMSTTVKIRMAIVSL